MNIVMLGHSGVGKTTYMASMYGTLQNPINGFSLKTEHSSDHERLVKNFYSIKRGYYPDATAIRSEYGFYLYHQGSNIFPFRWVDYRGGDVYERSDNEQAKMLHQDLLNANGVIVFVDCPTLASGNIRKSGIQRLINLLSVTLKEISHSIPVAIVLTKVDMVSNLGEREVNVLNPLIESMSAGDNIVGTIIPVACGTEMTNVEIPLLFNLFIGIRLELARLSELVKEHVREAEYYRDKENIFVWIGRKLEGRSTYSELANNEIDRARSKYYALQKLEPSAEALEKYLEECPIF